MKHHTAAAALALGTALVPVVAGAQQPVFERRDARAAVLGGDDEERARLAQLRGRDSLDGFLLRSPTSRAERLGPAARDVAGDTVFVAPWWPGVAAVHNSGLPFTLNDGALWAGKGTSVSVTGGVRARFRFVHLTLAPNYVYSQNAQFPLPNDPRFFDQAPPFPRSPYSYPWRIFGPSIDLPLRFGPSAYQRLDLGQSALYADFGAVEAGFSSENEWWGPGVRNALIMSNNAPGIPKLFVRTARPVRTRIGAIEARYILGSLAQSPFFEVTDEPRRGRSLSAAAVTLRPAFAPTFTIGLARSVFAQTGSGEALQHAFDVLSSTGRPNAVPSSNGVQSPGRDQLYSLFARYVLPEEGFESYVEWGRTEVPRNLRDIFVSPNHTQGYTLGLQYARPLGAGVRTARLQAEVTNVAQSSTFRQRPTGSWYTSRAAVQGYTQRGQVIGAAIGPGGASQWLAGDLFAPRWSAGLFAGRIRWDDDAYYVTQNPRGGFCRHDVSVFGGVRGSGRVAGVGTLNAALTVANRLNVFYQNSQVCFTDVGPRVDTRNVTLSLGYVPLGW